MAIDLEAIFIEVTRAIIVARFYRLIAFYGFYIVLYRSVFSSDVQNPHSARLGQ